MIKAEIQQILKMNKDGVLTDEQAADLLAELTRKEEDGASGKPGSGGEKSGLDSLFGGNWDGSFVEPILNKMNTTVKSALDAAFGWDKPGAGGGGASTGYQGQAFGSGNEGGGGGFAGFGGAGFGGFGGGATGGLSGNNHVHMSRFDLPTGKEHTFTGNTIRMSSVKDMRLDRAEMIDNTIDMSKAADFSVKDGKVIGCEIRASATEDWSVEGATVRGLAINGSKVADFHCAGGSVVRGVRVQGASIKNFRVADNSKVADLLINATAVSDLNLVRTGVSGSEIQSSHIAAVSLEDCEAKDLMVRLTSLKRVAFKGCGLTDVVFTGSDRWSWKKQGLKDVRFENCRMDKVLFTDCRLVDVTLRNVTLKDRQFRDLNLSGLVIDGDEAFLKAAGQTAEPAGA
ncbi:MAG: hypothetical protein JWP91_650 [Fibrobacteres bacterium]|nr:hypothetical protein [Fibrobacterota bacterium]